MFSYFCFLIYFCTHFRINLPIKKKKPVDVFIEIIINVPENSCLRLHHWGQERKKNLRVSAGKEGIGVQHSSSFGEQYALCVVLVILAVMTLASTLVPNTC